MEQASILAENAPELLHLTLLGHALSQAGTAILITDRHANIVWANQAYLRLSGLSKKEVIGDNIGPLNGASLPSPYRALRLAAVPGLEPWRRECSYMRGDGNRYVTEEIIAPLFDAHGTLSNFVVTMHDVTSSREALQQQRLLNNQDVLTGLACRSHITELVPGAIAAAHQSGRSLAMLFIDLDGFKEINDTHGHHIGDLVLKAIGARLQSAVRSSDTVARYGGDEFMILLPTISRRGVAMRLGRKIVKLAAEPFAVGTVCHELSASVGVAFYPEDGTGFDSLLISADKAMYEAKRDGGNQVRLAQSEARPTPIRGAP